jgi:hypothetical protein
VSVGDLLSGIGRGVATAGRVAGTVLEPFGKALAEEESGQLPQIEAEKRQQQYKLTDEERERKANDLESQLEMGRKYGTLTPEQQKQYVDQITGLYSKPEQQGSLLQRIHKAIHPTGTVRQAAQPLPSLVPTGGTAGADEAAKERELKARMESQKPSYKAYRLPDESIVNIDVNHEPPPDGAVPVGPEAANQKALNEYRAAQLDLQQKKEELAAAKFAAEQDPNNPATRQKYLMAQARMTQAQAYALRAQGSYLGTYNGEALPGAMLTGGDDPVGSSFSANIRPTGTEISRADLATSTLEQIGDVRSIVDKRPDLFGPAAGRGTDFSVWLGSQDPDAQRMKAAINTISSHLAGVFGSRGQYAQEDIARVIGKFRTNPEALKAALDQYQRAAETIQSKGIRHTVGGLPTDKNPHTGAAPVKPGSILPKTGAKPNGATMKVPGSDGKMHWSDGKSDLGAVE